MLEYASERRQAQEQLLDDAMALLHTAEKSSEWNWKSKFDADALATDAELEVPRTTLKLAEDIPNTVDLQHQQQLLVRLKQQYCTPNANQAESPVAAEFNVVGGHGISTTRRRDSTGGGVKGGVVIVVVCSGSS
jgi:hypothetical protein